MIKNIEINNIGFIKNLKIDFSDKINIISGESGSGKSMFINSIKFLFNYKLPKNFLKKDCNCYVNARIDTSIIKDKNILNLINDKTFYLKRTYINGKSKYYINDKVVSSKQITNIFKIDIYSQHEYYNLINSENHINFLDEFNSKNIKNNIITNIKKYKNLESHIKQLQKFKKEVSERLELYKFQINEIEQCNLSLEEENYLKNTNKIIYDKEQFIFLKNYLNSENSNIDLFSHFYEIKKYILNLQKDDLLENINDIINYTEEKINILTKNINNYNNNFENIDINYLKQRVDLYNTIKNKYFSINNALYIYDDLKSKLEKFDNIDNEITNLENEQKFYLKEVIKFCDLISEERKKQSLYLEKEVQNILSDLSSQYIQFKIFITKKKFFDSNGYDDVKFMIRTNPKEDFKEIGDVASGGELSRVIFALKYINKEKIYIFDEIDSGLSGITLEKLINKFINLSKFSQIICITHSPQTCSIFDKHFLINKEIINNELISTVKCLDEQQSIIEISRLIAGSSITQNILSSSKQLIQNYKILKQ